MLRGLLFLFKKRQSVKHLKMSLQRYNLFPPLSRVRPFPETAAGNRAYDKGQALACHGAKKGKKPV